MSPTTKRKRRTFAEYEKERIRLVRRHGACLECKVKKRKCSHVPDEVDDNPSPSTGSEDNGPYTPGSDSIDEYTSNHVPQDFDFGEFLSSPEVHD
ncbi:MAG: hypothetical protein Q9184_004406 [Pyrenodesmia sp. 2 TL-2023]